MQELNPSNRILQPKPTERFLIRILAYTVLFALHLPLSVAFGQDSYLVYRGQMKNGVNGIDKMQGTRSVAVSADGNYVYSASYYDNAISVFRVNAGNLEYVTRIDSSAGAIGLYHLRAIAASPDGIHLYSLSESCARISSLKKSGDSLTLSATMSKSGLGNALAVSPDGNYVYVVGEYSYLRYYITSLKKSGDSLVFIQDIEFGVAGINTLDGPYGVTVSPDGQYVYVAMYWSNQLCILKKNGDGLQYLTSMTNAANGVDGLLRAQKPIVSPDGNLVYVAAGGGTPIFKKAGDTLQYVTCLKNGRDGAQNVEGASYISLSSDGNYAFLAIEAGALTMLARSGDSLRYMSSIPDNQDGVDGLYGAWGIATNPITGQVHVASYYEHAVSWFDVRSGPIIGVTAPAAAETLLSGSSYPVSWNSGGIVDANLKLELIRSGTVSATIVASTANSAGHYDWSIPCSITPDTGYQIRISSASRSYYYGTGGAFAVRPNVMTITSPTSGQTLYAGTLSPITWEKNGATDANVAISLLKNSVVLSSITSSTPNDGSFDWSVPNMPGDIDFQITVAGTTNSCVAATSTTFVLEDSTAPVVAVSYPNGGERIAGATTVHVTWTAADNIGATSRVLHVSYNGGATWALLDSSAGNTGTYPWGVPDTVSGSCLVRVRAYDAAGNSKADSSNTTFSIVDSTAPNVNVAVPNGGESLFGPGSTQVTWTATDNIGIQSRALYLSTNGGTSWVLLDSAYGNTGSWAWTIAANIASNACRIKVLAYDSSGNAGMDQSNATFAISDTAKPSVSLVLPTGGQVWNSGSSHSIEWIATDNIGIVSRSIYLSVNNGLSWSRLDSSSENTGTWYWTIATNLSTNECLLSIRVFDQAGNSTAAQTDSPFQIRDVDGPSVTVTAPAGGESWPGGSTRTVRWAATDNTNIVSSAVYFSTDSGSSFTRIDTATSSLDTMIWTIPANIGSNVCVIQVRAYDTEGNLGTDPSNVFAIVDTMKPSVTIGSPAGSDSWNGGGIRNITWTADDNVGIVSRTIRLSTDAGAHWSLLDSANGNTGSYAWSIPATLTSAACLIRVAAFDLPGNTGTDTSNGVFTIKDTIEPFVEITTFNLFGLDLRASTSDTLKWLSSDNVSLLHQLVWFSMDSGIVWIKVDSLGPEVRQIPVQIPDTNASKCLWRVQAIDGSGNVGSDFNDSTFAVHKNRLPQISLLNPTPDTNKTISLGDSLTYRILVSDPDGDPAFLYWYVNGTKKDSGITDTVFTWYPDQTTDTVVVRAYDRASYSQRTFLLTGEGQHAAINRTISALPKTFALYPAYPNPFNPATSLRFDIPPEREINATNYIAALALGINVGLAIHDCSGRIVRRLVHGSYTPGRYSVLWDGKSENGAALTSGLYFCRIQAGPFIAVRTLILLK